MQARIELTTLDHNYNTQRQQTVTKSGLFISIIYHQDTRLCVMWLSLGARDTVCYLPKPTFSCFQPFIAQKLLGQF